MFSRFLFLTLQNNFFSQLVRNIMVTDYFFVYSYFFQRRKKIIKNFWDMEIIGNIRKKQCPIRLCDFAHTYHSKEQSKLNPKKSVFQDYLTPLTAEDVWFQCNLYLRFIPSINLWKISIDLMLFSKYLLVPFLRPLRSMVVERDFEAEKN